MPVLRVPNIATFMKFHDAAFDFRLF